MLLVLEEIVVSGFNDFIRLFPKQLCLLVETVVSTWDFPALDDFMLEAIIN